MLECWPRLIPDETQLNLEAKDSYKSQSYKSIRIAKTSHVMYVNLMSSPIKIGKSVQEFVS